MTLPASVELNAWSGNRATGELDPLLSQAILSAGPDARTQHLPVAEADPKNWKDSRVGWGVVLPDNVDIPPAARARVDDKDEVAAIQRLVAERRDAPVFRVGPDWRPGLLRRYFPDGVAQNIGLAAGLVGTGPGHIPRYLLIVGGPDRIPWQVQYDLHASYYVGRLDLDPDGLARYVEALLSDWEGKSPEPAHTLCWSVDHGDDDITGLMKKTIGRPMFKRFANDVDLALVAGAKFLGNGDATHNALVDAIGAHRPSLIVTTSHGQTGPLNNLSLMTKGLGVLIDADFEALDPKALNGGLGPGGAVWFAQACCSAGSTAETGFDGILTPGSEADQILRAVSLCGNTLSPFPKALLGGERPLRAFVGHVEPTFDWSLRHPETKQFMSNSLLDCFHQMLFTGHPIGMALDRVRQTGASYLTSFDLAKRRLVKDNDLEQIDGLLAVKLAARDWQSIVLLGDPTVTVYP